VIRFSALLVAVATGLLIAGVVTSKLALVYVAIGISALALVTLAAGTGLKRHELFGPAGEDLPANRPAQSARPEAVPVGAGNTGVTGGPASAAWDVDESASARSPFEGAGSFPASAAWPATGRDASRAGTGWPAPAQSTAQGPAGGGGWSGGLPEAGRFDTGLAAYSPPSPPAEKPRPAEPFRPFEPVVSSKPAPPPEAREADEADDAGKTAVVPVLTDAPAEDASGEDAPAEPVASVASDTEADAEEAVEPPVDAVDEAEARSEPAAEADAVTDSATDTEAETEATAEPENEPEEEPEPTSAADPNREVTVVPGVPRYHNASCILIRFMGEDDLEKMTLAAAQQVGCTPCRACLPDQEPADQQAGD